ncbi:putative transcriptional regulator [Methylobacterium sp. PvP062]|uniref:Transcriptional regulator n=1 Tax=Methylobacterium radiotolerans TaxID=31998 RepID=A0ABV2NFS8_9HYPH|nr:MULTISPECIES: MucR family transcriptional regulator [Methylobacterium]MCX7334920.1 MucR family transcriptional regulator [Hyphomicrobiales bacterium]KIU28397.1 MucR family transcriptional regulator [Methylobacterium radiotolerans]KTS11998.1 MucR family transcriptional regulator [Methylobacterium radiotolerans]KTS50657.1 MucR family transcriptional regulator [Methylobacterium radiotolerans]KZB99409.1 Transcriptional regulatory protein ros [Methylobacterium radiotolerans]
MRKNQDHLERTISDVALRVVTAYLSNNALPHTGIPPLLVTVHGAFSALAVRPAVTEAPPEQPDAAQIRGSVRPDGIVSFIDGRSYKTMKRHLTAHGLTPERYRARYGLPDDYPMTAPGYAERRSEIAKAIRLGKAA